MGITQDTGRGGDTSDGYAAVDADNRGDMESESLTPETTMRFKPERLRGEFWESVADECAAIDRRQIAEEDFRRCGQFWWHPRYRRNEDGVLVVENSRKGPEGEFQRETDYNCRIIGTGNGTDTECTFCGRVVMVLVKGDIADVLAASKRTEGKAQSGTAGGGEGDGL